MQDEDKRDALLRDEYFFLQQQYEDYDKRSLTIKGWVSSGAIAALALGLSSSYKFPILIPIFVAMIVAITWYLEAYWKLFQYTFSDRIRIIEAHFRGDDDILVKNPAPLQIYHWWYESYSKDEPIYDYEKEENVRGARPRSHSHRLKLAAIQRFVYLPYLPLLLMCCLNLAFLLIWDS